MSEARGRLAPDALLLDEMFSPRIAERLRSLGIDCLAVAEDITLRSQDDDAVLEAALATGRVLVTNNVGDFERLRRRRAPSGQATPPLIYTSDGAFPRNRRFVGLVVEALEYAARSRLVHAHGGILWLGTPPSGTV